MIRKTYIAIIIVILLLLSGCSNNSNALLDEKINPDDIDTIQVVLSMGNPVYGADSKIITDRNEIEAFVRAFNSAELGDTVISEPGFHSIYYFLLIHRFIFNHNDTFGILWNSEWRHISYDGKTPFELFRASTASIIVVDENKVEIERPQR